MFAALEKLFSLSGNQLFYLVFGLISGIVAIIAMLLLKAYLRNRALRPIDSNPLGGMDIDDLTKMQETGLLSEEEVKHIRQHLAQQFIEKSEEKKPSAQLPVEAMLAQAEQEARQSAEAEASQSTEPLDEEWENDLLDFGAEPETKSLEPPPSKPDAAAKKPSAEPKPDAPKPTVPKPAARFDFDKLDPIEIEELYQFGAITKEEYEAIKQQRGLT